MGWGGGEVALKWTNQKNSSDVAGRLRGAQLQLKEVNTNTTCRGSHL
jgi:hypothetical protein